MISWRDIIGVNAKQRRTLAAIFSRPTRSDIAWSDIESLFRALGDIDITDVITFEGTTVDEIRQAFRDSVDDYLEFCQELGKEPDKPFSGRLPFRTTPERHRKIFLAAKLAGKSMNAWMDDTLAEAAERVLQDRAEPAQAVR
jgi:predicted HicB family RNase H-like nuclease